MDLHDTDDDFGARTVSRPATPEILWRALRQYRHNNDNSPSVVYPKGGFVVAFDYDETLKVVATLQAKCNRLIELACCLADVTPAGVDELLSHTTAEEIE